MCIAHTRTAQVLPGPAEAHTGRAVYVQNIYTNNVGVVGSLSVQQLFAVERAHACKHRLPPKEALSTYGEADKWCERTKNRQPRQRRRLVLFFSSIFALHSGQVWVRLGERAQLSFTRCQCSYYVNALLRRCISSIDFGFWHGSGTSLCLSFVDLLMSVSRFAMQFHSFLYRRPALVATRSFRTWLWIIYLLYRATWKQEQTKKRWKWRSGRIMQSALSLLIIVLFSTERVWNV